MEDLLEAQGKELLAESEQEEKVGHYFVVAVQDGHGIVINQDSLLFKEFCQRSFEDKDSRKVCRSVETKCCYSDWDSVFVIGEVLWFCGCHL